MKERSRYGEHLVVHVVPDGKEEDPDSYDAISRTGRAVFELVKKCPGAVMRAGLMQAAATLLKIPVSALEESLGTGPEKTLFLAGELSNICK